MDRMIFTVLNGMKVVEKRQANTFNELANVSTVGFKKSMTHTVDWRDLAADDQYNTRAFPVLKTINRVELEPGPMMVTGNNLDVYLNHRGLIAVQGTDGTEAYTRRGDLKLTENGLLTVGSGDLVLGENGPITIPPSARIELSADGVISVIPEGEGALELVDIDRIKIVNGADENFQIRADGLFETADQRILPADGQMGVVVGALESSAASPIEAMVQMIKDSREYEMHVRVIKNAKELSQSSASMVRIEL